MRSKQTKINPAIMVPTTTIVLASKLAAVTNILTAITAKKTIINTVQVTETQSFQHSFDKWISFIDQIPLSVSKETPCLRQGEYFSNFIAGIYFINTIFCVAVC